MEIRDESKYIANQIRAARINAGISQQYIAFELEISQAAYSKIEAGETRLYADRIYEIAEILKISPFSLMPKPKYGSGINQKMFYALTTAYFKVRQFYGLLPFGRKKKADADKSDISNNASI